MNVSCLVPDPLWEAIEPLLPAEPPKPNGGRPRIPARAALGGIVFVLRTGCPWRLLPKELGCGSGTTCWRRLRDWQEAGVWDQLHETLLNWLGDEAAVDWSRSSVDSLSVRAKRGASRRGETRRIAASSAPSTILWWIVTAFRSQSASRLPTSTTPRSSSRWLMPSRPSSAPEGDLAVLGSDRPNSRPTKPTTQPSCVVPSALAASPPASPVVGLTRRNDSVATAGSSSARCLGCSDFAASACATSGEPTCSRACSTWRVP